MSEEATPLDSKSSTRFTLMSWGITALIVFGLLAFAYGRIRAAVMTPLTIVEVEATLPPSIGVAHLPQVQQISFNDAISRALFLKTKSPPRPRYNVIKHTVLSGDSVNAISSEFKIEPETLLFANTDFLHDDPHGLRPGMKLLIPPTDGIYYQWQPGDTLEAVAAKYESNAEAIVLWPGNNFDITNPQVNAGDWVMLPGGVRELKTPELAGGGSSDNVCGTSYASRGFLSWPTASTFISGNDFWSGHPGIDIAANEGDPIYAADNGIVVMAQEGYNSGYGNVIQIDHGDGFITLYAHLSSINVSLCESVFGGQYIGAAGNTGNSFGAHLHFEVKLNGVKVNPHGYLP